MQILILQTAFTGDVILATSLYETLRKHFPDAQIDFLVRKGNDSLLKGHPGIREILVWNKDQKKYRGLFRLLRRIRKKRYDLLVNCQRFFASGYLSALSGAKHISGFSKNPWSRFFHHRAPHHIDHNPDGPHEIERNFLLIRHLVDVPVQRPQLYPDKKAFEKVAQNSPYFCLAPTSVWFTKQWPAENWIRLIRQLPAEHSIFLLGAPSDLEACAAIQKTANRSDVYNMAGKLSLLESAALMQKARMNFVNDSAPTHLASAMNAPVTTIFCSTVPEFGFTPLSEKHANVETAQALDCRPCGLHGYQSCPKGHFRCAAIEIAQLLRVLTASS